MARKAKELVQVIESIAPRELAAQWDNVGLLMGSPEDRINGVLLAIDLTEDVLEEARQRKANGIVAYHPPFFHARKNLTDSDPAGRILLKAAREKMLIYSPHTALDACEGGINDWLATGIGPGDVRALVPHDNLPENEQVKIVTICPEESVARIRDALGAMGAGTLGEYSLCSFEIQGTGTFLASDQANPSVGGTGALERVPEVRLEMACSNRLVALAVLNIRQFHPYEEPPIEIHALEPKPMRNVGEGRRLTLDRPLTLKTIGRNLKNLLGVTSLQVSEPENPEAGSPMRHQVIGLCPGAGGSLLGAAMDQGCTLFITGEMRHHDVLEARSSRCAVMLAGHSNTERPYLDQFRDMLESRLDRLPIMVSDRDVEPLRLA